MHSEASDQELIDAGMAIAVHARRDPDGLALKTSAGSTRTWKALDDRANQLARAFFEAGLAPGDGVALLADNTCEFVETWAACHRSGLRLTPMNWHQSANVIGYIIDNCDARALVVSARFEALVTEALTQVEGPTLKVAFGGPIAGFIEFEALIDGQDASPPDEPQMGSYMLYTSGTTGRPKGVYRAVRPAVSQLTEKILDTAAFVPGADVALVTGPLYHAAPLALNLVTPLNAGVACILMDKWDGEETLRLVDRERVTHTHVVPTMFHRLLQLPEPVRSKYDLSSLRWVLHGAAPCPVHVKREMIDWLGPIVFEYYSSTEGGGVFITSEEWLERPGSVGRPVEGVGVRLLDADGNDAAPNVPATIYIRAPETGRFVYYKDDEKTKTAYKGDYFTLGDLGYVDDEGFIFLTGRSAELIISGGVNIYPAEVDEVLTQHALVGDAAAVGVPNEEWGEEVKAVIELKPGQTPSEALAEEILAFAAERLPGFQRPRSIDFVEALPRSAAGKVLRQVVRAPYWEGRGKS